jgi:hypothetical protein
MRVLRSRKALAILASVIAAGIMAAVAISAITSKRVYADGTSLHYHFERNVADGLDSGWHVHPGLAIVQVEEGSLQITQGSCTPKTVGANETFIEVPWKPVRATATGRVVWTVSLLTNPSDPLQIPLSAYSPDQPNPCP